MSKNYKNGQIDGNDQNCKVAMEKQNYKNARSFET